MRVSELVALVERGRNGTAEQSPVATPAKCSKQSRRLAKPSRRQAAIAKHGSYDAAVIAEYREAHQWR